MVGRQAVLLFLAFMLVVSAHAADAGPVPLTVTYASSAPVMTAADEQRLAILAGKMLNLTKAGEDYALDCGPASEVLALLPKEEHAAFTPESPYCVLNTSGMIIFGTFGDADKGIAEYLQVYNDTAYRRQLSIKDIKPAACDGKLDLSGFVECPGAMQYTTTNPATGSKSTKALYVYAYVDSPRSDGLDAAYIIVSEKQLSALSGSSLWQDLAQPFVDFFNTLVGWL